MQALAALWLCLTTPTIQDKRVTLFQLPTGTSPFSDFRHNYEEEQRTKVVAATRILDEYERPAHLKDFVTGGEPLLAIDRKGRRVVVNEHHLSEIHRADATGVRAGERVAVGTIKSPELRKNPRLVLRFLLESELIISYVHTNAQLTVADEKSDPARYRAALEGFHVYYTNSRHQSAEHFAVEIDLKTGAISVVGL